VGFAAESQNCCEHARAKRLRKGVPLIVANLGPATFGRDDNTLVLVDAARRARAAAWPTSWRTGRNWCAELPATRLDDTSLT
jgi:hypothetical protein